MLLYCVNTLNGVMEKCELCYKPAPVNYRLSGFTISGRVHNACDAQRTKRFKDRLCAYCEVKLNPKDVRPWCDNCFDEPEGTYVEGTYKEYSASE